MSDYMENGSPDLLLNESPFRELSLGKATRNTCRLWFTFSFCFFTICHLSASAQLDAKNWQRFVPLRVLCLSICAVDLLLRISILRAEPNKRA
jgi:hypothetical protein